MCEFSSILSSCRLSFIARSPDFHTYVNKKLPTQQVDCIQVDLCSKDVSQTLTLLYILMYSRPIKSLLSYATIFVQLAHKKTHKLIESYQPFCQKELFCKEEMLELIVTCDDCFCRSCRVGHFTASAFLLNKELTHALLMHHRKLDKWIQLGGHCDGDPDILGVAIKEAQEESGISEIKPVNDRIFDIDIHLVPPINKDEAHYHFDIRFLLHAYKDDRVCKNHESKALRWVRKDAMNIPSVSDSVRRMFRKIQGAENIIFNKALTFS